MSNHWLQAKPVCVSLLLASQQSGSPDPERSAETLTLLTLRLSRTLLV
jgi:hypothetical protein